MPGTNRMNFKQAMARLKALGTAQNIKIYTRHGANPDKMFGVSYANLNQLAKQLKRDHALACQLYATDNLDAMVLATLIADPAEMSKGDLDAWAKATDGHYMVTDYYCSKLVVRSPHAKSRAEKWCKAKGEGVRRAGWSVLALLTREGSQFSKTELTTWLARLEEEIHGSPNRARQAMLGALIAIGGAPGMKSVGLKAARRIGPVEIDHGETSCKTHDAVLEINKIHDRLAGQKGKKAQAVKLSHK